MSRHHSVIPVAQNAHAFSEVPPKPGFRCALCETEISTMGHPCMQCSNCGMVLHKDCFKMGSKTLECVPVHHSSTPPKRTPPPTPAQHPSHPPSHHPPPLPQKKPPPPSSTPPQAGGLTRMPSYLMRNRRPAPPPPPKPVEPRPVVEEQPAPAPAPEPAVVEEQPAPEPVVEEKRPAPEPVVQQYEQTCECEEKPAEEGKVDECVTHGEGVTIEDAQYTECGDQDVAPDEEAERKERRELAVKELIDTELVYYQDLLVITSVFLDPMKNNKDITALFTPAQFRDIYSNFEVLPKLHSDLLASLLQPDCKVADAFLQYVAYFRMYVMYCNNLDKQDATINGLLTSCPAFAAFAAECKRRPECRSLDMLAFLIKPLQRICKYPLLLREIIKNSDPDDFETKRLKEAESQMQQILTKINTQKRMVDTGSTALELQEKLINKHGKVPALISPARRFLRHGPVTEIELPSKKIQKDMYYILCSDILLRLYKKSSTQLEIITVSLLDSVGVLALDKSFQFPSLGRRWSSLKAENCLELFIHEENKENPIHVLACLPAVQDTVDWKSDFDEAKKTLLMQDGLVPLAI